MCIRKFNGNPISTKSTDPLKPSTCNSRAKCLEFVKVISSYVLSRSVCQRFVVNAISAASQQRCRIDTSTSSCDGKNFTAGSWFAVSLKSEGSDFSDSYTAQLVSHGGPPWGQKYEADSEAKVLINKIISPSDLQIVSGHTSGTCTLVHQFKVLCQDGREPINGECAPACEAGKIKVGTVCVMKMISATFSSIKLEKVLRKHNPDLIGVRSATGSDELVLQPNVEFALDAESKIAYIGEPKGWLSIGDFQAKNGSSTGEMHAPLSFEFANIPDGTKLEANIAVNGTSERMALCLASSAKLFCRRLSKNRLRASLG